jgi:hypothetical protein
MSERADELARRFEEANNALIAVVESSTDEQLQAICPDEEWTVVAAAYHVGANLTGQLHWLGQIAAGQPITTTWDEINRANVRFSTQPARFTRNAALTRLRDNGAAMATAIRALSDEQIKNAAAVAPADDRVMTTDQVIKWVIIKHIKDHLASIRSALAKSA